ncbi:hypothetical protein PR202_gb20135 [Eleusine coracana subsp. coracana]|uniref:Uncharacterized protein n=1 Tax=Eleusine coracana subsp. coracana TaxID=191504 RepID=A0AAV5F9X4_ELECO|nr:hypothetical protein QOZ80_3BG0276850 [Eleusine coracana subsp. coracana]GJN31706.1 hypothetical protein PR202_gb20135 [Eleusine coracana subsp. coracana]
MLRRQSGVVDQGKHLYLVDGGNCRVWNIREVDLSSGSDFGNRAKPLPPAVFSFVGSHGPSRQFASAFGTSIMSILPNDRSHLPSRLPVGCFPIFDVRLNRLIFGPSPQVDLSDSIYIPVGHHLFALASGTCQLLCLPPPGTEDCVWEWHPLSVPPFDTKHVTSYAVHPDGRAILISTKSEDTKATFILDVAMFEWRKVGNWTLPFNGRGYFDSDLNSFVGLSTDPDTLGHLYSCAVICSDCGECQAPAQRLSKESLFSEAVPEEHVGDNQELLFSKEEHLGATLVYTKGGFCLVQGIKVTEKCADDELKDWRHMFRLTKFSLEYDSDGNLLIGVGRQVQFYEVPEASITFLKNPVVFYL